MRASRRAVWGAAAGLVLATGAAGVPVADLTFVPGIGTGWAFYLGSSAYNGGPAGEWTARVGGLNAVGYLRHPFNWTMTSGVVSNLAGIQGAYRAAWLMDRFALGFGNDGIPPGWGGGPVSDADKRAGLAIAIFEVGLSPESEPPDLDAGTFNIWYGPETPLALARAYLAALAGATLDQAALEAEYDVVIGDQWGGTSFANLVALIEQPVLTRIDVTPASAAMEVGESCAFTAAGVDQYGQPMAMTQTWSAAVGIVDSNGLYVATAPGTHAVLAGSAGSPVTGTGTVAVVATPITNLTAGASCTAVFQGFTTTVYTLQRRDSLVGADWGNVPGAGPVRGSGGTMTLTDTNAPAAARFYRLGCVVEP